MIIIVDNHLHEGYDNLIADNGSPLLLFLSNNYEENGFPTKHTSSNTDAIATTTAAAIAAAAAAPTAAADADSEDEDNDKV